MWTEGKLEDHLFKKIPEKTIKITKGVSFLSCNRWRASIFPPALYNGLTPPVRGQGFPLILFADPATMVVVK